MVLSECIVFHSLSALDEVVLFVTVVVVWIGVWVVVFCSVTVPDDFSLPTYGSVEMVDRISFSSALSFANDSTGNIVRRNKTKTERR